MAAASAAGPAFKLAFAGILFFLSLNGAASGKRLQKLILGGQDAARGQFPWQVLFVEVKDSVFSACGGSIIDRHWVLTAAHCIHGPEVYLVFGSLHSYFWKAKEPDTERMRGRSFIVHEGYVNSVDAMEKNIGPLANDIALIKLPTPLKYSDIIRPVRLPRRSHALKTFDGETMTISGWGLTRHSDAFNPEAKITRSLKFTSLVIDSNSACSLRHMICTNGDPSATPLEGDSGGALVWRDADADGEFVQIGVASFIAAGFASEAEEQPMMNSNAFTFVPDFLDWIAEKTGIEIED